MSEKTRSLLDLLHASQGAPLDVRLESLVNGYREQLGGPVGPEPGTLPLTEGDAIMVARADSFRSDSCPPPECLLRFLDEEAEGVVAGVHLAHLVLDGPHAYAGFGDREVIDALSDVLMVMIDIDPGAIAALLDDPDALFELVRRFLAAVESGARLIRLDLTGPEFASAESNQRMHAVVKLVRAVCDDVAPWVVLVVDTDATARDPGYFGDDDEAHLVGSPVLAPLVLDAFLRGDAALISEWARSRPPRSAVATYYNYLDSPDGIAVARATEILGADRIASLVDTVEERGGIVVRRETSGGEVPTRAHVGFLDAIVNTALPDAQRAAVYLAAQSIMLSLAGVPEIPLHSLIGTEGAHEPLDPDELTGELNEEGSLRNMVFEGYKELLRARAASPAFAPSASQTILDAPAEVFALLRTAAGRSERVLCLVNLTEREADVSYAVNELGLGEEKGFRELISGDYVYPSYDAGGVISLELQPYEVMWLSEPRHDV
jgi:glucosylglycerate phosphorylase